MKFVLVVLIFLVLLLLIDLVFGSVGTVKDAKAADGSEVMQVCNANGNCANTTQNWLDRGQIDRSKTRTTYEPVYDAMAATSSDQNCKGSARRREMSNHFGMVLMWTKITKRWCYDLKRRQIVWSPKARVDFDVTQAGGLLGWEDKDVKQREEWIPYHANRYWGHESFGSAKFKRCLQVLHLVCLGSTWIDNRIIAYGNGRFWPNG